MKKGRLLAVICMTLISVSGFAQMRGGMGRGGMMGGGQPQPQAQPQRSIEVNLTGANGFFVLDTEEALKKMKIKDPQTLEAVTAVFASYAKASEQLVDTNRSEIDILEFAKESIEAAQNDMSAMRDVMTTVRASSQVIRPKMIEIHKALSADMAKVLNAKELKGWKKYYDKVCDRNSFDPDAKPKGSKKGHPEK